MKGKLSTACIKNAALVAAGISPRGMSIKPGTRVERDRKKDASRGYEKHRTRY